MVKALALLVALPLVACTSIKHRDDIPQKGVATKTITWVMAENPEAECDKAMGKRVLGRRIACAMFKDGGCTIYAKAPRNEEDRQAMYILGHEALHCFVGEFHY